MAIENLLERITVDTGKCAVQLLAKRNEQHNPLLE